MRSPVTLYGTRWVLQGGPLGLACITGEVKRTNWPPPPPRTQEIRHLTNDKACNFRQPIVADKYILSRRNLGLNCRAGTRNSIVPLLFASDLQYTARRNYQWTPSQASLNYAETEHQVRAYA